MASFDVGAVEWREAHNAFSTRPKCRCPRPTWCWLHQSRTNKNNLVESCVRKNSASFHLGRKRREKSFSVARPTKALYIDLSLLQLVLQIQHVAEVCTRNISQNYCLDVLLSLLRIQSSLLKATPVSSSNFQKCIASTFKQHACHQKWTFLDYLSPPDSSCSHCLGGGVRGLCADEVYLFSRRWWRHKALPLVCTAVWVVRLKEPTAWVCLRKCSRHCTRCSTRCCCITRRSY